MLLLCSTLPKTNQVENTEAVAQNVIHVGQPGSVPTDLVTPALICEGHFFYPQKGGIT